MSVWNYTMNSLTTMLNQQDDQELETKDHQPKHCFIHRRLSPFTLQPPSSDGGEWSESRPDPQVSYEDSVPHLGFLNRHRVTPPLTVRGSAYGVRPGASTLMGLPLLPSLPSPASTLFHPFSLHTPQGECSSPVSILFTRSEAYRTHPQALMPL